MHPHSPTVRTVAAACAALALSACAGTYTGPVEVTRFVSERPAALGQGAIALVIAEEVENANARAAFREAVGSELLRLGYILAASPEGGQQAIIRTRRTQIAGDNPRSPVTVGSGASTGSYGSGVGLGIGINLGGGRSGPNVVTELEVRISDAAGEALWEGRAQIPTSIKSPYSDVDVSARTLAAALFKDFPGGNGETVTVEVDELNVETQGSE
ncbi:hypothetical protein [Erythrobacter sp. JK5]|uniref:hypothetical protein n=1 Tax=Erythrobacter sp. JK5 TaxID=2829500 RepID=UPI001BA5B960|nr:hypothetical protein [Erythrobacter sp. JK5]QUL37695.1 hypothetical protein KDC96_15350 [Erythrobacter sp. JK5]